MLLVARLRTTRTTGSESLGGKRRRMRLSGLAGEARRLFGSSPSAAADARAERDGEKEKSEREGGAE